MGNSNGNIHKYWEAIDSTFGLQGGFIWDWVDQGLLKESADGSKHWAYGGDFGDVPNDLNFCLNGLIWPDRTPHPAMHEVKYVYQPIKVSFRDEAVKVIKTKEATFISEITGDTIKVNQQNLWEIILNVKTGAIESWKIKKWWVGGVSLMKKGIFPCFWRAPTDNDKGGGASSYFSLWKAARIDSLNYITKSCSINSTEHFVKVAVVILGVPESEEGSLSKKKNALFEIDVIYTIYGSGDVLVECNTRPSPNLPPLPRVGVKFHLDKSLDQIKWYGRGPFECYLDRKAAAPVAVYEQNVGDMHVPYIVPGECSGRADVRWVTFQNKDGFGIYASIYGSSPPMQINASYYTTAELDRPTHNHDLVKGDDIGVASSTSLVSTSHFSSS